MTKEVKRIGKNREEIKKIICYKLQFVHRARCQAHYQILLIVLEGIHKTNC